MTSGYQKRILLAEKVKDTRYSSSSNSFVTLPFAERRQIAIEILNEGRIGIAAQMLGLAQGAFDKAVPYTYQRKQFGQPVGTFQGMSFQMAGAAVEIET